MTCWKNLDILWSKKGGEKMKIYELTLQVYLLKDIPMEEALEKISELVDKSLISSKKYKEFHNKNQYKFYAFNSLYKLEKDKIYKEGKIYTIKLRTVDKDLSIFFKTSLVNEYTNFMKGLTIQCKEIKKPFIEKIYTITPLVIKTEGYWKGKLSLEDYERRIRENIIKKYNDYFDTKLDEDFELFRRIEFDNKQPIATVYKNIKLLGDKVTFYIAENQRAQDISYFALGSALGEINARGYGFVNYKKL